MTEARLIALFAAAALAQSGSGQTTPQRETTSRVAPAPPSAEDVARIERTSAGYARIVGRTLAWRTPATPECQELRVRIDLQLSSSPLAPAQPFPADPVARIEIFQRVEENAMARHSLLSQSVYEATSRECLVLPEPDPAGSSPGPGGSLPRH